jgi:hypothetical protein
VGEIKTNRQAAKIAKKFAKLRMKEIRQISFEYSRSQQDFVLNSTQFLASSLATLAAWRLHLNPFESPAAGEQRISLLPTGPLLYT